MAEKKVELDPKTQDPKFLYHLTQPYMMEYVKAKCNDADKEWFAKLILANKKTVKRGDSSFTALDQTKVRKEFAKKFFPELLNTKKKARPSIFDEAEALLASLKK